MAILDFFKGNKTDINEEIRKFRSASRAVLIDVRDKSEYAAGHIPRSRNIPLSQIEKSESGLPDKTIPVFVYCKSGSRSKKAAEKLRNMGYENVTNIGGIDDYKGKTEKSDPGRNRSMNNMKSSAMQAQKKDPWNKGMPKVR